MTKKKNKWDDDNEGNNGSVTKTTIMGSNHVAATLTLTTTTKFQFLDFLISKTSF